MGEKVTKEQLTEIIKESTQPLMDEVQGRVEELNTKTDEKLAEMRGQIEDKRPKVEVGDEDTVDKDPKGGFKTLSHFARDVAHAEQTGHRKMSGELQAWAQKAASSTTMEEGEDQYGGYLIPPEFKNELWLAVEQRNEILPRCTEVPMASSSVKIPYVNGFDESGGLVYGGIAWYWTEELGTKDATRPKVGRIGLELKKVAGLAYSSDELLQDSPISMENILKNGFKDGLNFQLNKVLLKGNGAGQPLGVINAPATISITKESGQAGTTIVQ